MAITIGQISSFVQTHVVPKLVENIIYSSALAYRWLKKPKRWTGGDYFDVPIRYGKNTNAEAYSGATQLTTTAMTTVTKARFSPRQYNTAVRLTGIELEENKGPEKVLDLVKEKMKEAEQDLKDLFGTDIIASQAGQKLDGLGSICAAHTSSLGGVSSGDAAEWLSSSGSAGAAGGPDSSTTSLTRLVLDKQFNSCKIDEDKPNLIVTTDDIWAGISSTFLQPNMRYTDAKMADLGFENFKYRAAIVITDSHVAAGDLYTLNEDHIYFAVFPGMNFKFIPFHSPVDYDYEIAHIRWYGNLICDERRKQGWMSAITGVA